MAESNVTTVFLTPEEVVLFTSFQKRFAFMKLLESIKAFDLRNGSIEIHFDGLGGIAKVDKNEHFRIA